MYRSDIEHMLIQRKYTCLIIPLTQFTPRMPHGAMAPWLQHPRDVPSSWAVDSTDRTSLTGPARGNDTRREVRYGRPPVQEGVIHGAGCTVPARRAGPLIGTWLVSGANVCWHHICALLYKVTEKGSFSGWSEPESPDSSCSSDTTSVAVRIQNVNISLGKCSCWSYLNPKYEDCIRKMQVWELFKSKMSRCHKENAVVFSYMNQQCQYFIRKMELFELFASKMTAFQKENTGFWPIWIQHVKIS